MKTTPKHENWIVYRLKELYRMFPNQDFVLGEFYSSNHRFIKAYSLLLMRHRREKDLDPRTGEEKYSTEMTLLANCNLLGGMNEKSE